MGFLEPIKTFFLKLSKVRYRYERWRFKLLSKLGFKPVYDIYLEKVKATWGKDEFPAEWNGKIFGGKDYSARRWEYEIVLKHLNPSRSDRILDVGAGRGYFSWLAANFSENVYYNDLGDGYRQPENGVKKLLGDVVKLKLKKGSFDKVCAVSTLEHFPSREKVKQFLDVAGHALKKGGMLYLTTEWHPVKRLWFKDDQFFNEEDIEKIFLSRPDFRLLRRETSPIICYASNGFRPIFFIFSLI